MNNKHADSAQLIRDDDRLAFCCVEVQGGNTVTGLNLTSWVGGGGDSCRLAVDNWSHWQQNDMKKTT